MMNLAEYRRSNTRLADFLPWAALVDEGVVLNKDGSFQRTAKFRGPDLDSAVPAELVAVAGRLNNALRRLGSGWAIFVEGQRHSAGAYPPDTFPDVASALVDAERPDAVIVATGAKPRSALNAGIEGVDGGHVVSAWDVIRDQVNIGSSVVIADWRCDWIGLGLAEKLARAGCRVRLCVDGYMAGQRIHQYVRDHWVGELHKLNVEIIPYARLYGVDGDTAYFQHATSGEPIIFEAIDTVVASLGHERQSELEDELAGWSGELHVIGDCLTPRTAEEAVLEDEDDPESLVTKEGREPMFVTLKAVIDCLDQFN